MPWDTPTFVEVDMNAEIGAYQQDDGGDRQDPIVEREDEE